jgi:hypothetical protein
MRGNGSRVLWRGLVATGLAFVAGASDDRLNGTVPPGAETRALLRSELRALDHQLEAALTTASDGVSVGHLQDARDQIARILDPRAGRPAGGVQ